jgi:hypothetical protein
LCAVMFVPLFLVDTAHTVCTTRPQY